ncbi:MAG: ABC-type metal ion transport system, periplasmic component/surface adhesin [uncultured bacterium]|nr:MAG: ABC-type metal ion transport system, periplasmic component/surface adhesin [uncultured bacterium]
MKSLKILLLITLVLLITAWLLFLKNSPANEKSNKLQTIVTFYPLEEFAESIGKDQIDVTNLTPPGSEPHEYEPTPKDIVQIKSADLFVHNGAGFENWVEKILPDLDGQKTLIVDSSKNLPIMEDTIRIRSDPHFWLDPNLAKLQVENIEKALIQKRPEQKVLFENNALNFQKQLLLLDQEISRGLADCRTRKVISSHDAFSYFAIRYNLTVLPIAGISPEEEPTPQRLAQLTKILKKENIKYVFFETLVTPKLAQTLADEVGAEILVFNPIEGLTTEELGVGKNYFEIQRENLKNLQKALECNNE